MVLILGWMDKGGGGVYRGYDYLFGIIVGFWRVSIVEKMNSLLEILCSFFFIL